MAWAGKNLFSGSQAIRNFCPATAVQMFAPHVRELFALGLHRELETYLTNKRGVIFKKWTLSYIMRSFPILPTADLIPRSHCV